MPPQEFIVPIVRRSDSVAGNNDRSDGETRKSEGPQTGRQEVASGVVSPAATAPTTRAAKLVVANGHFLHPKP